MAPDYKEIIAGTDIEKNPELPAPKKIIGHSEGDIESGQVESPLSNGSPLPPPSPPKIKKKLPKRECTIRETDNGYVMRVYAGTFVEEWVFTRLSKVAKTLVLFFKAEVKEE